MDIDKLFFPHIEIIIGIRIILNFFCTDFFCAAFIEQISNSGILTVKIFFLNKK